MKIRLLFLLVLSVLISSCQFTETMVMELDGSGSMSMELDLSEMMSMGAMSEVETAEEKVDTLIYMKDFLEEKKDSISKLPKADQEKLKKLEKYKVHINMDSKEEVMKYNISVDFKNASEANDIINAMKQVENIGPSSSSDNVDDKEEETPDIIGVRYSFENNTFKRDAFIKDVKLHKQQVDSLKQTEAFFTGSIYALNYTFPRKIKNSSNPKAVFSNDKKTIVIKTPFLDYFKDPDVLDLMVELED